MSDNDRVEKPDAARWYHYAAGVLLAVIASVLYTWFRARHLDVVEAFPLESVNGNGDASRIEVVEEVTPPATPLGE